MLQTHSKAEICMLCKTNIRESFIPEAACYILYCSMPAVKHFTFVSKIKCDILYRQKTVKPAPSVTAKRSLESGLFNVKTMVVKLIP